MFSTLPCCKVRLVLFVVERRGTKALTTKKVKLTLVVSELPSAMHAMRADLRALGFDVWPGVNPACTSAHENVQIITHEQSQRRQMEQSLP